jgi:hypothetical protein
MENRKILETGISDFKNIIENNCYFVDKTALIYDFFTHGAYISLMPRPKRFGKTLNLSMIEHFFDIQKTKSAMLFSGFNISEQKEFCKEHQNKYPVINISFKDVKENNWNDCRENFKELIFDLYEKFDFLAKSDKLKNTEKIKFDKIISGTASDVQYKFSLMNLSVFLRKHFKNKVIILVDEYDTPIINAFKNTPKPIKSPKGETSYYENVISFMQTFLGKAYKGNEKNLRKGLITGVMRVARESIFSDWNNFNVYSITSNYFSESFGFTQSETEKIVTYFGLQDNLKDIEKWYNGYKFGNIDKIYNPWSIVNYILNEKDGFKAHWVNTSDYSLIKERITEQNVTPKLQKLIEGKTIDEPIYENFIFSDFETDSELLWTLLTYNGYLTQLQKSDYDNYKLKIPNNEVKKVFTDIIMNWLKNRVKLKRDLIIFTADCLINNKLKKFETGFKRIVGDTISYYDTAEKHDKEKDEIILAKEQIYHVYTLGLLAILSDDYIIKSNREGGEGRYDIMLIPHDKIKNGVVIEIKSIGKQKENEDNEKFAKRIDDEIVNALNQIERNKYYKELLANKIPLEQINKVPIVFAGKEPYITKSDE